MTLAIFKFESVQVRTLGTVEAPLFVAIDIAAALGFKDKTNAIKLHVDQEDLCKQEIETAGGRQIVNCVNESGLYALIFGSQLDTAKRFKRWVTSEVLPALRRTGKYECPVAAQLPAERLSETQAYTIQSEVGKRARGIGANYQTIYRALKARFKVTKYTHILARDFDDAVHFIRTCDLKLPDRHESAKAEPQKANQKMYQVSEQFVENQRTFVYCWRYLFRDDLERFYRLLCDMNSPYAPRFWEAIHNLNLATLENSLDRLGFPVKDLDCYKHWASKQIA